MTVLIVMGQRSQRVLETDKTLPGVLPAFAVAAFFFRDGIGPMAFLGLAIALLVQILRVAFSRGRREALVHILGVPRCAVHTPSFSFGPAPASGPA
jgi:hypothetical protein